MNKYIGNLILISLMSNFFDLKKNPQFQIQNSHDLLIMLLNQIFGQDSYLQTVKIDLDIETDKNHQLIMDQWDDIHRLYKAPNSLKKTQKLVRQTLKHIVNYLNNTHNFAQPIKWEQKRFDFYQRGCGKIAQHWAELTLKVG